MTLRSWFNAMLHVLWGKLWSEGKQTYNSVRIHIYSLSLRLCISPKVRLNGYKPAHWSSLVATGGEDKPYLKDSPSFPDQRCWSRLVSRRTCLRMRLCSEAIRLTVKQTTKSNDNALQWCFTLIEVSVTTSSRGRQTQQECCQPRYHFAGLKAQHIVSFKLKNLMLTRWSATPLIYAD